MNKNMAAMSVQLFYIIKSSLLCKCQNSLHY